MGYFWLIFGNLQNYYEIFDHVLHFCLMQNILSLSEKVANYVKFIIFLGKLLKKEDLPEEEERFQKAYVKAPSFLSIHMAVKADVLPPDTDCHHFILEVLWQFWRI